MAREEASLAFANTLSWRGSNMPTEALADFAALLSWCRRYRLLPRGATDAVARWAHRDPLRAAALHADAIVLREAIHGVFGKLAAGEHVRPADLAPLCCALEAAPPRRDLVKDHGRFAWRVALAADGAALRAPALLAPVVWSAADLLTGDAHRRVRRCRNASCLWLFIDQSKSGTRRWCDMTSCGNRAKAQRHYRRWKASQDGIKSA
jgi:predicted RNA-binding Zn ribbon-like protein